MTTPDRQPEDTLYRALARAILLATGVFLALWFLDAVVVVVLLFATAFIFAVALNPPVMWLEERKVPRPVATLLVCLAIAVATGALGWLVVPRIAAEVSDLASQLPQYAVSLQKRAVTWVSAYPQLAERLRLDEGLIQRLWPMKVALARVGRTSLSLLLGVVFALLLVSTVIYTLACPQPLLKSYLDVMPLSKRGAAERAFIKSSQAVTGWLWSNVILGAMEAVAAALVLSVLGVPGALVWAALTFFAALVPLLGPYLMTIPPVLVALAVEPMTALWVAIFYIVMLQLAANVVAPLVRSSRMKLHPVSLLFSVLALGSIFGVMGALIATPVVGILKAFYEEFFGANQPPDEQSEERIENMLKSGAARATLPAEKEKLKPQHPLDGLENGSSPTAPLHPHPVEKEKNHGKM